MDINEAALNLTKLIVEKDYVSVDENETYTDAVCKIFQQCYRAVSDPYNED
jgi:hypothetical protein